MSVHACVIVSTCVQVDKVTGVAVDGADAGPQFGSDAVDPTLYHFNLLNRLELRLPAWTTLSPLIGHLSVRII